jgi:hypothetical protein
MISAVLFTIGMSRGGPGAVMAMAAFGPVTVPIVLWALLWVSPAILLVLYLGVKLSLAAAQTMGERSVRPFDSWRLTRGRFWRLLAAYLLAPIPMVVVVTVVTAGVFAFRGVSFDGGVMEAMNAYQPFIETVGDVFSFDALLAQIPGTLFGVLVMPALYMPAAAAYARLAGTAPVEDVF